MGKAQAGWMYENSLLFRAGEMILYPLYKTFWWKWQRDIALQRGYAMDDFYQVSDKDLRRSPFFEHIWRETCHPYQYLMAKYKRMRYYKVERIIQGFYVPDHLRDEAKKKELGLRLWLLWRNGTTFYIKIMVLSLHQPHTIQEVK